MPELLSHYASVRFNELFATRPTERGSVCMGGTTIQSPRWHQSFMHTPLLDNRFDKQSYMFAGTKKQKTNASLPIAFQPFLDYVNAALCRNEKTKFNQVVINWYETGDDYVSPHSDCLIGMVEGSSIVVLSLVEGSSGGTAAAASPRTFRIQKRGPTNDNLYKHVDVKSRHGSVIQMCGRVQQKFRHGVPKTTEHCARRISITFRKYE